MKQCLGGKLIAIDTETTGLDPWTGSRPFMVSLCNKEGESVVYEWPVDPFSRVVSPVQRDVEEIKTVAENEGVRKVFHNSKFDIRMLRTLGIGVAGKYDDTMYMAHVVNSAENNYQLKPLALKYLGYSDDDEKALHKAVIRARNYGRKHGWTLAFKRTLQPDGTWEEGAEVEADYWMVRAMDPENDVCLRYATGDVERTILLREFYQMAIEEYGTGHIYQVEMALAPIVEEMERTGVYIDNARLEDCIAWALDRQNEQKKILDSYTRGKYDYGKNRELGEFLFKKLGLQCRHWTKTGQPSVDKDSLETYEEHPFVNALFRYRSYERAIQNYFLAYKAKGVPEGKRGIVIHPSFQQTGPRTGRFACRNPNLQNVTSSNSGRGQYLVEARRPFGPRPGRKWYSIDYEQLEIRIFADIGNVQSMIEAINRGEDIHTWVANEAWGLGESPASIRASLQAVEFGNPNATTPEVEKLWIAFGWKTGKSPDRAEATRKALEWLQSFDWDIVKAEASLGKKNTRNRAKLLIFTKIFGGGIPSVTKLLRCTGQEAKQTLDEFDEALPGIKEAIKAITKEGERKGYVETLFGRRLTVDRGKEYRGVNYRVQGSAADHLKRAMIRCDAYLRETGLDARLIMSIHDEIVFEFRSGHAYKTVLRQLCRLMEQHDGVFRIATPTTVKRISKSWNESREVEL